MYLDKLDGRIDAEFFDRQAAEWRTELVHILRSVEMHAAANQNYIEEGIKLLQLARRAHELFENQPANEKRKLLDLYSRTLSGRTVNCWPNTGNPLMCWRLRPPRTSGRDPAVDACG